MKSFSIGAIAAALLNVSGVFGHGYVSDLTIGGTTYIGYLP